MAKILVVDDAQVIRDMMQAILKKNGHTVTLAEDGMAALAIAEKNPFDIIFTDINMPHMSGITLTGKLKELDNHKYTPVVMVTTENAEYRKKKARDMGAAGWLVKPISEERVLQALNKLV